MATSTMAKLSPWTGDTFLPGIQNYQRTDRCLVAQHRAQNHLRNRAEYQHAEETGAKSARSCSSKAPRRSRTLEGPSTNHLRKHQVDSAVRRIGVVIGCEWGRELLAPRPRIASVTPSPTRQRPRLAENLGRFAKLARRSTLSARSAPPRPPGDLKEPERSGHQHAREWRDYAAEQHARHDFSYCADHRISLAAPRRSGTPSSRPGTHPRSQTQTAADFRVKWSEVEIEGIGILHNPVKRGVKIFWIAC